MYNIQIGQLLAALFTSDRIWLQEKGYLVMTNPTDQVDKVIQLYETMLTRHTTMVVGPTGGGKTVILETLSRAQTKMGYPTTLFIINSKAQPTHELYGLMGTKIYSK
jgi:dynein heavy chain